MQVHEIGYTECAKSYVFRGSKDYSAKQVQEMLGLLNPILRPGVQTPAMQTPVGRFGAPTGPASRFLMPVQQADFQLIKVLEGLQKDPWPVANDRRSLRCTGVALCVAVGLLESSFQNAGGRIMLFTGGPATEGPGMVVGAELREPIRSHHDIDRESAKYYKKALKVSSVIMQQADYLVVLHLDQVYDMATVDTYTLYSVLRDACQTDCPQWPHN